jgi:hypothetical protein
MQTDEIIEIIQAIREKYFIELNKIQSNKEIKKSERSTASSYLWGKIDCLEDLELELEYIEDHLLKQT